MCPCSAPLTGLYLSWSIRIPNPSSRRNLASGCRRFVNSEEAPITTHTCTCQIEERTWNFCSTTHPNWNRCSRAGWPLVAGQIVTLVPASFSNHSKNIGFVYWTGSIIQKCIWHTLLTGLEVGRYQHLDTGNHCTSTN